MSTDDATAGYPAPLAGKHGLVLGLADDQSIAWGCLELAQRQGAKLIATCLNDKIRSRVAPLAEALDISLVNCNVENPEELEAVLCFASEKLGALDFVIHSIAWAGAADLGGRIVDSSSEGFCRAMTISCHSFAQLARWSAPLMSQGGAIIAMSYLGAERVVANYSVMGPIKAALESLVRYVAVELGPQAIRVNAVSPGPIPTRAASGIREFDAILEHARQKSPLSRLVTLEEIAGLTLFLCSATASGITGQTIYVDAGCSVMA